MSEGVTAGRIIRRGMDGMRPAQYSHLLENADKVEEIINDIEDRRQQYLKAEADARARSDEADKKEAALAEKEAKLVKDEAVLEVKSEEVKNRHLADMDTLHRRVQDVQDREEAVDGRSVALDAREKEIEAAGIRREDELNAREESIKAAEKAAEDRDAELLKKAGELSDRERRIVTAEKMVKQAAAGIV